MLDYQIGDEVQVVDGSYHTKLGFYSIIGNITEISKDTEDKKWYRIAVFQPQFITITCRQNEIEFTKKQLRLKKIARLIE